MIYARICVELDAIAMKNDSSPAAAVSLIINPKRRLGRSFLFQRNFSQKISILQLIIFYSHRVSSLTRMEGLGEWKKRNKKKKGYGTVVVSAPC
jgi:hypothetical protein